MYPIITISREFGSGGHAIAEAVVEKLGIPFLDKDVVLKVAEEMGIDINTIETKGEHASKWSKYLSTRYYNGLCIGDEQDEIFERQRDIILDFAKKGPCVIVGRCSDYILKEAEIPAVHVFIHADKKLRIQNVSDRIQSADLDIEKLIDKNDKGRKYYYKYYTDTEFGAYENYDLSLDTSKLGEKLCVEIITAIAEKKNV